MAMFKPKVIKGKDTVAVSRALIDEIAEHNPDAVFIDLGGGAGVYDYCSNLGYKMITGIHFGSTPNDPQYFNKRAEMWYRLREWIRCGGSLPEDTDLNTDLTVVRYDYNVKDKKKLESKEDIKKRLGASPDCGDAAALTFAERVVKADTQVRRRKKRDNNYNPWDNM